ncbi:MAG: DUF4388 domain-containing protein, partial [Methylococcales bacterium]|nr:DUF4388 domain-containing protein [Methylococcales bacterium]
MKKILIVLHDTNLLTHFKIWLHNNKNSNVILVSHSFEGCNVLKETKIDTLIMDLEEGTFDSIDLLLFCIKNNSNLNLVILSDLLSNDNYLFSSFNLLKKSLSINHLKYLLVSIEKKSLSLKAVKDILISDFFCLVQMKQKTCLIEIKSDNKKGFIYFNQGKLFDCLYNEDKGQMAFLKILKEKCKLLSIRSTPTRPFSRHIMTPLLELIKHHKLQCNDTEIFVDEPAKIQKEELVIIEEIVKDTKNEKIDITKTKVSSNLMNEKQRTIESKKIESTNSLKRASKVLDRSNKKSEDNSGIPTLNDKVAFVFEKSKLTGKEKMALQDCVTPLQDIDGYLASAVFDMSGEVLVQHNNSKFNVALIGANAIAM